MSDIDQRAPRDDTPHPADEQRAPAAKAVVPFAPPVALTKTNETSGSMLAARATAEIQARRIQAINFPRELEKFRDKMLKACDSFAFCDAAVYEKPVGGGKTATGLGIRFAEEAARHYCNLDVSTIVVSEDDDSRVIEAVSVDLETNYIERAQYVVPKFVERLQVKQGDEVIGSRQNSRGVTTYRIRANDDALFTVSQNVAAKARREAILIQIPFWIKEECEEKIERTMQTVGGDPKKFLAGLLKSFAEFEVTQAQIERLVGKSTAVLTVPEMRRLKRIYTAIKTNETTWADVMAAATTATAATTDDTEAPAGNGAGAKLKATAAKAAAKADAAPKPDAKPEATAEAKAELSPPKMPREAPEPPKVKRSCPVCFRNDGTHDPNANCYSDPD